MRMHKLFTLLLALGIAAGAHAAADLKTGEMVPSRFESPHPVSSPWQFEIGYAGARSLRFHLAEVRLGEGDQLSLFDPAGREVFSLQGPHEGSLWLPETAGDWARLEIWPAKGSAPWGLRADWMSHGFPAAATEAPAPESICGVDDSKDAVCYQSSDPTKWTAGMAVARIRFSDPVNGSGYCTGFLVSPYGYFLTNNHCVATEVGAQSLVFDWEYQNQSCGAGPATTDSSTSVAHLVSTDYTLDYALVAITNATPQATYGYLTPNPNLPKVGDTMWIAGHPLAAPKRFSVYSDMDNGNAKVQGVGVAGNASGTDIAYYADTQGGSSGSPVMAADNTVIALHHFGVSGGQCTASNMNQGVEMAKVYNVIATALDQFFWPTASATSGSIPLSVAFSANPLGGQAPFTFDWNFGDGSAHSSEQNPSHTYSASGSYGVSLTVHDSAGRTGTDTHLLITATRPNVLPPVITGVIKLTNPLRLKINGSNFHSGCTVKINGAQVPVSQWVSATLVKAKGSGLKAMLPRGQAVQITVTNNDDGGVSLPYSFTR